MKAMFFGVLILIFSSCGEDSDGGKSMIGGGDGGNNGASGNECESDEDCKLEDWPRFSGTNGIRCEPAGNNFKRCAECSEEFPCPEGYYCSFNLICYSNDP
jgi:hypothetical protein